MKNIDIWRMAVPLDEAEFEFPPQSLWRKYRRKQGRRDRPGDQLGASIGDTKGAKDLKEVQKQMLEHLSELQHRSGIRAEIRGWLMRELSDGRLLAYGYRMDEPLTDEPVEVPPYMFDLRFANWVRSSLKGLGQEFVRVRVINARDAAAPPKPLLPISATEPMRRQLMGRPTYRQLIDDAISSLAADGVNLAHKTMKQNGEIVRRRITEQTGNPTEGKSSFGDETIRRRIAEIHREIVK